MFHSDKRAGYQRSRRTLPAKTGHRANRLEPDIGEIPIIPHSFFGGAALCVVSRARYAGSMPRANEYLTLTSPYYPA